MDIKLHTDGLYLDIAVSAEGEVFLRNLGPGELPPPPEDRWYRLTEVQMAGFNQNDHHGNKKTGTEPGSLFRYAGHRLYENNFGQKLEIEQHYEELRLISHLQFFHGLRVVESWSELINKGDETAPALEYLSSFSLTGLNRGRTGPRDREAFVWLPHSTWFGEAQWQRLSLHEAGLWVTAEHASNKRIVLANTGSWPADEYLPMGAFEDVQDGRTICWQIETAASWTWEISDIDYELYLKVSAASFRENHFAKKLKAGERFCSEKAAVALVTGDFYESIRELTKYRRRVRRPNKDNAAPQAIFNDYMNCLWGCPTMEKEIPLIDRAAELGFKYYCIDCGWYSDGAWWTGVGEWLPSQERFPHGIEEAMQYIRGKGMLPGLWLEIEAMGIHCPLAAQVPQDWFFQRDGRPIIAEGRYFLDFRNPEVRAHADEVIDRLVRDYGVAYIKNDYNIDAGPGTELGADSPGDGLLAHTRAFLAWLDEVLARYPNLVFENCSSGGLRMTWAFLKRLNLQSVTDQTDYLKMAAIACNCVTALPPEQAAIWSYPLAEGDEEETIFNMVNALLLRLHQSGPIAELAPERLRYVREAVAFHHAVAPRLTEALPFWPSGLADFGSPYCSFGLRLGKEAYLAVWNLRADETIALALPGCVKASLAYPAGRPCDYRLSPDEEVLRLKLEPKTARIFHLAFAD